MSIIPEGWIEIPNDLLPIWEQYKPFVTITISNDVITSMTNNEAGQNIQRDLDLLIENMKQINILKSQLSETDYKIIKCYEYNLVGLPLPYDIIELNNERQTIRDLINALETI